MAQVVDEVRRETMRSGVAREFRAKRIELLAGGGLRQVLALQPGTSAEPSLSRMIRSIPAAGLAELGVEDACTLPDKPERPAGSAMPVRISRQPSPSAMSSQAHSQRRIGPF